MRAATMRFLPSCVIILLVSVLAVGLAAYRQRLELLELEGNDLYTSEAATVSDTPEEALALLDQLGEDARIYLLLYGTPNVRAVAANQLDSLALPVHDGPGFTGAGGEVLAGANAAENLDAYREAFDLPEYRQVGTLGITDESMLADVVLIADRALFSAHDGVVMVDGPGAAARYAELRPDVALAYRGAGVSRRIGIDVLSPVLVSAGVLLGVVGCIGAGVLFGIREARIVNVRNLLGQTMCWLAVARMVLIALMVLLTFGIVAGIFFGSGICALPFVLLVACALAGALLAAASSAATLLLVRKEG